MNNFINDNDGSRSFAILDLEFLALHELYGKYARLDPREASLRWPFKSVCAAALLTVTVTAEGLLEVGRLDAWSGDDEGALVRALFNRLDELPQHTVVTWSGLHADLPALRIAAMQHHLRLPHQLVDRARERGRWLHLDLAKEMKGDAAYVHMSEAAVRLDLPVKFADRASMVPSLLTEGKLRRLADIAVADVVTTACLLFAHLEIRGELTSAKAAQILTLREVVRARPEARYADYLRRVERRICASAFADAEAFVASAA